MSPRKFLVGTALTAAALYGGTAAASDYPPDAPPPSTVLSAVGGQSGSTPQGLTSSAQLPSTGNSGSDAMLKIGGAAVLVGAGLVVAAKRRRHVAPT